MNSNSNNNNNNNNNNSNNNNNNNNNNNSNNNNNNNLVLSSNQIAIDLVIIKQDKNVYFISSNFIFLIFYFFFPFFHVVKVRKGEGGREGGVGGQACYCVVIGGFDEAAFFPIGCCCYADDDAVVCDWTVMILRSGVVGVCMYVCMYAGR